MLRHILNYKIKPKIKHLILYATHKCNLRCKTCFVVFQNIDFDDLSLEAVSNLSRLIDKLYLLEISGGEPFLRDDLPKICGLFNTSFVNISTNGTLKDKIIKMTNEIKQQIKGKLLLSLSLDGFEDTNDLIRGEGHYEKALATYMDLKKIDGISLKINTVLCDKNINEIEPFLKFVRTLKPDFHSIIFIRGTPYDSSYKLPSLIKLRELKPAILDNANFYCKKTSLLKGFFLKRYYYFLINRSISMLEKRQLLFRCLAGVAHCVVYANGDVSFCEMLSPIGNIKSKSFQEIWNSEESRNLRRHIKEGKCFCTHNCAMLDSFIFNLPNSLF